jgi:uncharacterized protein YbjT (DUF2867 family)
LPTAPRPGDGRILVTGATGYIGGHLVPELLARGYAVRAMVRAASPEHAERWPAAEVVAADATDEEALVQAMTGVHTAYYLMHSLLLGPGHFEAQERVNAANFRRAAERSGVSRIIYLGGLGDVRTPLSPHLRSRAEVAGELRKGAVPVTVLRAAVIIGAGSASYEILRHLVKNVPVFAIPFWSRTHCQPIAVRDVIRYLVGVLERPDTADDSFDIGGSDVLSYEMMIRELADILNYRRFVFHCRYSNIRFFSYLAGLMTPVPAPITRSLMEGLLNDAVCESGRIRQLVPFPTLTYREAVVDAMTREEQDRVHTRWSDAYPPAHELAIKLDELAEPPRYTARYEILTPRSPDRLFASICRIGGREGWFHSNWMWRLRGMIDRVLSGVGSQRGRRSSSTLRVNDVIDFWRVEVLERDRLLRLRAEMKLPGKAWLEFRIEPQAPGARLVLTAYYDTRSLPGRLYWYAFLPTHGYIFGNLLRQIDRRSTLGDGGEPPAT